MTRKYTESISNSDAGDSVRIAQRPIGEEYDNVHIVDDDHDSEEESPPNKKSINENGQAVAKRGRGRPRKSSAAGSITAGANSLSKLLVGGNAASKADVDNNNFSGGSARKKFGRQSEVLRTSRALGRRQRLMDRSAKVNKPDEEKAVSPEEKAVLSEEKAILPEERTMHPAEKAVLPDEKAVLSEKPISPSPSPLEATVKIEIVSEEDTEVKPSAVLESKKKDAPRVESPVMIATADSIAPEEECVKEPSVEDFTEPTAFRTAQIIICGRTLHVNPYSLVEHSDIMANIVQKSGPRCKVQLDFLDFDALQTTLRIFCRNPVNGLKERLNDPNQVVARKKLEAIKASVVFMSVLRKVIATDDAPLTDMSPPSHRFWLSPSQFRKFELIPSDAQPVFVNMDLIKEYSSVLASSPAVTSDYCMLPQFTSTELVTALGVLFRTPINGRFYPVTVENIEVLYKCAGLFECLRVMCDSFSRDSCLDAVLKVDWVRLKAILTVQARRRKGGESNKALLTEIITSSAKLLANSANVLEKLQAAQVSEVPMGIGNALIVSITEARLGAEQFQGLRLIL